MKEEKRSITIRGGGHHQMKEAAEAGLLKVGTHIELIREPENAYDKNAIKAGVIDPNMIGEGGLVIGYVAREMAHSLAPMMDEGRQFECTAMILNATSVVAELKEIDNEEQDEEQEDEE